eukprot:1158208-Pelagomonas_calceolata.AAC.39
MPTGNEVSPGVHSGHHQPAVSMQVPNVAMNPPLELIQDAINQCAKKVLTTSKMLPCWGKPGVQTYHELIAGDKEIVKSILRLTGSVEGIKSQVRVALWWFEIQALCESNKEIASSILRLTKNAPSPSTPSCGKRTCRPCMAASLPPAPPLRRLRQSSKSECGVLKEDLEKAPTCCRIASLPPAPTKRA